MRNKIFAVPFDDDERMYYAKRYLSKNGFEINDVEKADYVLLPIPVKPEHFAGTQGKRVFYGYGDFEGYDYNKNEAFLVENAYLTAEGAVALYKESSKSSLLDAKALIVGYGRIGKSLHKLLNAYGCKVTVCSRSQQSRAEALYNNAEHIKLVGLSECKGYDVIFNTIPRIVFSKKEIDAISEDALYIELASFPGGIDKLYAKSKGVRMIDGRQLPLRYSPETAGYLIARTVISMIEEGLS